MSETSKDKLSFILYQETRAPRYFEVKKSIVKFLVYILPCIALMSLILIAIGGLYFKDIQAQIAKREPKIITELKMQNSELTEKKVEMTELISELQDKLAGKGSDSAGPMGISLFRPVSGQKDLSVSQILTVDDVQISSTPGKANIKFNLTNVTKEQRRLSGHIFILMKTNNKFAIYPFDGMEEEEFSIKYNKGESFATSRFRPVDVTFDIGPDVKKVLFNVVIFTRTGDLLSRKLISQNI
jgi:hypothetical protein